MQGLPPVVYLDFPVSFIQPLFFKPVSLPLTLFGVQSKQSQTSCIVQVFNFLIEWLKHDKVDGKYIESVTGKDPIWNYIE